MNWITISTIYLLMSFGFSLVFGVLRIFHFGYTVTYTLVPYLTWILWKEFKLNLAISFILMIFLEILFALAFYKGIIKPFFMEEGKLFTFSLLVWIALEELINYRYPPTAGVNIPIILISGFMKIGSVEVHNQLLLLIVICAAFVSAFILFLLKTKTGLALRAVSQSKEAAEIVGIDAEKYYVIAMILSVFPPILCFSLILPFWEINPYMGFSLLLTSLFITIVGGLGNLKGTILASFMIGFIYSTMGILVNPRFMFLAVLIVTIIILILRPRGLISSERVW